MSYARHAPCAANDTRLRPSRHTRPQSQLCNLRRATSLLPHHCTSCRRSTMKALGPNTLSPSGLQSATVSSVGHRTIETLFPKVNTTAVPLGTWTRARPAGVRQRHRNLDLPRRDASSATSSSVIARWRAAVQYPPGLAAESLGLLSCLLGFDAVSL